MRMKFLLLLFINLLFVGFSIAQSSPKIMGKSFSLLGNNLVEIELGQDVLIERWSNPSIRVEMSIQIENGNNTLLKALVTTGRYNIKSYPQEDRLLVRVPGLEKDVNYKGSVLKEIVSFKITLPNDVELFDNETTSLNK